MIGPMSDQALKHLIKLMERVQAYPDGDDLSVPCPHPSCSAMLHVRPADNGWPMTLAIIGHNHAWTLAHRECVEIVVREYRDWYAEQAARPLPF